MNASPSHRTLPLRDPSASNATGARSLRLRKIGMCAAATLAVAMANPAVAMEQSSDAAADEEAPPPPVVLRVIPPRFSWDAGFQASFGMMTQFQDAPPWLGLGFRGGWGRNFGGHRVGAGVSVSFEGPIAVQWSNNLEPHFLWDFVDTQGKGKGLMIGASVGPALIMNADIGKTRKTDLTYDIAPMAAVRIGYSQPWSLIAKRFWVAVEPKVRLIDGKISALGAIVIGSGRGY